MIMTMTTWTMEIIIDPQVTAAVLTAAEAMVAALTEVEGEVQAMAAMAADPWAEKEEVVMATVIPVRPAIVPVSRMKITATMVQVLIMAEVPTAVAVDLPTMVVPAAATMADQIMAAVAAVTAADHVVAPTAAAEDPMVEALMAADIMVVGQTTAAAALTTTAEEVQTMADIAAITKTNIDSPYSGVANR